METHLGTPVELVGVEHVGLEEARADAGDVVRDAREDDRLGPEAGRGHLGDQAVADRADGDVVDEGEHEEPVRGEGVSGRA